MALAEATHHTAPRGQRTARARREDRDEMNFAVGLTTPSPEAASTMYYRMDDDGEVRQMKYERHCGSGFELVLDVTVSQMGRELVEVPNVGGVPKFLVEVFLVYAQDKVSQRVRQRQWWSILHPQQRCSKRQRQ